MPSMKGFTPEFLRLKLENKFKNEIFSNAAMSGLTLMSLHFPALMEFEIFYRDLVGVDLFFTVLPLSHRLNVPILSLFHRHSHDKFSDHLQSLVPTVQTFIDRKHHLTFESSTFPPSSKCKQEILLSFFCLLSSRAATLWKRIRRGDFSPSMRKMYRICWYII